MTAPVPMPEPMRVVHCGPAAGKFDDYEALMSSQWVMYNFVTCKGRRVPSGIRGLYLDSGAFQAWKRGTTIDPDAYAEYCAAMREAHGLAIPPMQIDVIGGTEEQQRANLRLMDRLGLDVTPVFHGPNCESWHYFDELCERFPVVAIGSVLPDNTSDLATEWLSQIFDRVCDPETGLPRVKLHGLRMASRVRDFPFASVDGSTWVRASKNGRGPTKDGGQVDRPWKTTAHLCAEWVRFYDWVPKCTRWIPRYALGRHSPQCSLFELLPETA